ncbi:MAG: hypothetical protein OXG85_02815 [Chloroflexi bacterium]|nr:hypothetical protein [Chloroflexota bacterium]
MPDEIHVAHALYYFSVRIYDVILPNASPVSVNVFSMITFMSPLLLLLYALLKRSAKGQLRDSAIAGLAICLFLMAPIYFFADNRYMTGYVNSMVWHSPTYHALRLFIVPVSLLALRAVDGSAHRDRAERAFWTLLTAGLLSLATFAKPSYTIALLPGCCLFALCRVWIRQPVDWSMLLLGIVLPGAVMLGLQYLVNFGNGDDGIQFGVILSARFHVESTWQIPFRIILSLAFPLSVYLLYFSESRKHTYLNLSWLICMLGLFFMYFFNVTGWRSNHAVFNWTAYSAAFALMYASTQFLMEKYSAARRRPIQVTEAMRRPVSLRPILVATMFGLHVGCGIVYYFQFLSYPG